MKRLLLELGGKGAALVFDDADLDAAVTVIGSVWTFHSGQICTAPTRAIVHRSQLRPGGRPARRGRPATLKVGDPLDEDTVVGPVITAAQRDRVEGYVARGRRRGRRDRGRRSRPGQPRPRLLRRAHADRRLQARHEAGAGGDLRPGGRGACPFDDDDEAVAIANSTDFGLYDYVFTDDTERGFRVAERLRSGNVGINTAQRNHEAPFGGFKMSGIGRDGGDFGLHAYTELQSSCGPA